MSRLLRLPVIATFAVLSLAVLALSSMQGGFEPTKECVSGTLGGGDFCIKEWNFCSGIIGSCLSCMDNKQNDKCTGPVGPCETHQDQQDCGRRRTAQCDLNSNCIHWNTTSEYCNRTACGPPPP